MVKSVGKAGDDFAIAHSRKDHMDGLSSPVFCCLGLRFWRRCAYRRGRPMLTLSGWWKDDDYRIRFVWVLAIVG